MKILIKNVSNTLNYGSMMMGENIITYLLKKRSNINFYVEADDEIHIERLREATQYKKIYLDEQQKVNLITKNIKYVRFFEKRIKIKNILFKVANFYDAIIILGGDDFAETYYKLPKDNSAIKALFKDIEYLSNRLKVVMIGQTIGPYTDKRLEWAKEGLKNVKIYTRDDISKKYLKKELNKESSSSRDLAFLDLKLQPEYEKKYKEILSKYKLKDDEYITFVGTSLISHYTTNIDDFLETYFNLIKKILTKKQKYKLVWLSHVFGKLENDSDNYMLKLLNEKYNNIIKDNFLVIDEPILPIEARIILGHGKLTITCRMHAAVSTFQMGKPAICLSYSKKFKGVIADGLNSEDLVIDAKGNEIWSNNFYQIILDKIEYVFKNYDKISNKIKNNIKICKKYNESTLDEIAEYIFKKRETANNLDNNDFICTGCFVCEYICPQKAIIMKQNNEGFFEYFIDKEKCINCGKCVKNCPKLNHNKQTDTPEVCYAAFSKDNNILKESSSGGIFSEIAKYFLNKKGVVIGAAWVDNQVKHILIDSIKDLYKLRSSKYIQSDLSDIYKNIKQTLDNNKQVLFSGTPCQVAAAKILFNNENFFTIDLVCHGVASKKTLDLSMKQRFNRKDLIVDFRNKSSGWHYSYSLKYLTKKDKKEIYIKKNNYDSWFRKYLKNYFLKKDCYDCKFTGENRTSDITLGDFWQISEINKTLYNKNKDKGVSLVLLNTKQGQIIFDKIKDNIVFSKEKTNLVIKHNPRLVNGKYNKKYLIKRIKFFYKMNKNKIKFKDKNQKYYDIIDKINSIINRIKLKIRINK